MAQFPGFTVKTTFYKRVRNHGISVGVFVPKALEPGSQRRPVVVRFHGGFLVSGAYDIWIQPWLLDYTALHGGILVSADYRLMPEANGLEVMEDVSDLWSWVFNDLQDFLGEGIKVDLDRILIEGDSAGGYLAVQSALTLGRKARAMIAVYPPLDLKIPFFTSAYNKDMEGFPMYPTETISGHVSSLKGDEVVTSAEPPDRLNLGFAAIQHGQYADILGEDSSLYPMERLVDAKDIPSVMILHGRDDSAVPCASSEGFVNKLRELHPKTAVHYHIVPGGKHGVDAEASLETPFLKAGLDFITPRWLENKI